MSLACSKGLLAFFNFLLLVSGNIFNFGNCELSANGIKKSFRPAVVP